MVSLVTDGYMDIIYKFNYFNLKCKLGDYRNFSIT